MTTESCPIKHICLGSKMNQEGGNIPKNERASSSKVRNLEEERGTSKVSANQCLGINRTIQSSRSKRNMNSTKGALIKREEGSSLHSRKRKGKVGDTHVTKEQSLPKRVPRRSTMPQQHEGPKSDIEKRDQFAMADLQAPRRKRSREAVCNAESQHKPLRKPRKSTKAKNRFLPQLTKIREEISSQKSDAANPTQAVYSTIISEYERDKSKLQSKTLIHSKSSSSFKNMSSQHVKSKIKRKSASSRKGHNHNSLDKTRTRKISLKEKSSGAGQSYGSHALHSLRDPTFSKKTNILPDGVEAMETYDGKEKPEGTLKENNRTWDISNSSEESNRFQSKATATALKLAHDTSGFVRTTLKAVQDSKNINLKIKGGVSLRRKKESQDSTVLDTKLNVVEPSLATRYKSTLESLQNTNTLTAEKLIEELGSIGLASKGNASRKGKVGRVNRQRASNMKNDSKDRAIGANTLKENAQTEAMIDDRKKDLRSVKLDRKTKKSIENQLKKYGIIDKAPPHQGFRASVSTKKAKSAMAMSGFDRLISGANGNKEFESALAQIVSSHHHDELGWTKDQEKALQNAYLSIQQTDGEFWHLVSKEVPGRSANECYDRFYSRHPTPSPEGQVPTLTTHPNKVESPSALSDSPDTKSKVIPVKISKKQKKIQPQKTVHNMLGHVESLEGYKQTEACVEYNNNLTTIQDVGSVLDRLDDEKAVILQSNFMKDIDDIVSFSPGKEETQNNQAKVFFENVLLSGVGTSFDKENSQPSNGKESSKKKFGVPRVELILKQVENGQHLPYETRPKTSSNASWKKKIIKTNNVYLHSKDALDFGDTTSDAIQRAKQELRNVISRTGGSRGGSYSDFESVQINA